MFAKEEDDFQKCTRTTGIHLHEDSCVLVSRLMPFASFFYCFVFSLIFFFTPPVDSNSREQQLVSGLHRRSSESPTIVENYRRGKSQHHIDV
jgi:hypothetical protein